MSMLSAQCDELRELATRFDEIRVGATRAVRIPSDTGSVLREAADTIWELRDDLQRANAENTKLRGLVADMYAVIRRNNSWWDWACKDTRRFADRMRELGVEVEQ